MKPVTHFAFVFQALLALPTLAEPSAFEQALSSASGLTTHESIVEIGGRKYRKIEYKSETYFLQLLAAEGSQSDLAVLCGESLAAKLNNNNQPLIKAAVRVTKRTKLFVEGLHNICTGSSNRTMIVVSPDIQVGFMLDDSDDPKALFRDRRITVNPLTGGLGFGASW